MSAENKWKTLHERTCDFSKFTHFARICKCRCAQAQKHNSYEYVCMHHYIWYVSIYVCEYMWTGSIRNARAAEQHKESTQHKTIKNQGHSDIDMAKRISRHTITLYCKYSPALAYFPTTNWTQHFWCPYVAAPYTNASSAEEGLRIFREKCGWKNRKRVEMVTCTYRYGCVHMYDHISMHVVI